MSSALAAVVALFVTTGSATAQRCAGDCNGDGGVSITELILAVDLVLGSGSLDACRRADSDFSDRISIGEVIAAVQVALNGCTPRLSFVEAHKDVVGGVRAVALSPDGGNAYAVGANGNAVEVFARDLADGTLTFVEAHRDEAVDPVTAVVVSPDGGHVYAAGNRSVATFRREPSGELTLVDVGRTETGDPPSFQVVGRVYSLVMRPDGTQLYATVGSFDRISESPITTRPTERLVVFDRDVDSGTLELTAVHEITDDSQLPGHVVAVSPDGAHVYSGSQENGLVMFDHDSETGALVRRGPTGAPAGIVSVSAVAVSADGSSVYVAALVQRGDDWLYTLDRRADGTLARRDLLLGKFSDLAISADGTRLYASAQPNRAGPLTVFARDTQTGALTLETAGDVELVDATPRSLRVSPDGAQIYGAVFEEDALVTFSNAAPIGVDKVRGVERIGYVRGLTRVQSVAVSPDGRHVYAGAALFARDSGDGSLTFVRRQPVDFVTLQIDSSAPIVVSPNGAQVYAGTESGYLGVYDRDAEGALRQSDLVDVPGPVGSIAVGPESDEVVVGLEEGLVVLEREAATGEVDLRQAYPNHPLIDPSFTLGSVVDASISPDGGTIVSGSFTLLTRFQRQQDSGLFARDNFRPSDAWITDVAFSPDGSQIYATSFGIVAYSRGELIRLGRYDAPGEDVLFTGVALTPGGDYLFAASASRDGIRAFQRDPRNGSLVFLEAHTDGASGVDGLDGAVDLAVSPDGRHLYVVAGVDQSVAVFAIDADGN